MTIIYFGGPDPRSAGRTPSSASVSLTAPTAMRTPAANVITPTAANVRGTTATTVGTPAAVRRTRSVCTAATTIPGTGAIAGRRAGSGVATTTAAVRRAGSVSAAIRRARPVSRRNAACAVAVTAVRGTRSITRHAAACRVAAISTAVGRAAGSRLTKTVPAADLHAAALGPALRAG